MAQAQGWWDGEEEFNFSQVFSPENPPARMELAKQRYKGGTGLLQQHDGEGGPLLQVHSSEIIYYTNLHYLASALLRLLDRFVLLWLFGIAAR